ncbi:hypothetical protein [Streptococcus gallolyticus]|uniref:hypothetical protein n=1 Tax=Streptococcus gallolyticus TaxID=315405 RepID=UPI0022837FD1|nr:hypothetical protein [Streptococcus gallolyticus]MCY7193370.1 hypothetical protein [Streptococcus gallolyticus subsp. gallolyticus]
MNNVRIAIRDSTDSHNVAFFDNQAGIKYKKAELQRFLAGSASILTLQYNSKDIDTIRTGCKLAFRYKARDYWLNIMKFEKQGFEVEITACSLHLELNNEERGAHKPDKAMSFAEYLAYYDPEHSVTLGINQVSDKRIKLEWTGTDTILARLFSIANSFDAELEFVTELNDDYSLKRHVLNVYKKGNLGSNKTSSPVRVGKELKVINYSDSIEDLRTAVRATGKDGLTIDGLNKKIYDDNKQLLYYSSGNTVYAPQSRDRFPSVGQASNDNWLVKDLGETEYETKEGLWGYMYGEIQKICLPKIEYKVTGAIDSDVGDTQALIDDVHYEPPLYLKARVSELTDDILQGKVIDSTFINFERQYSQIADSLLKQVEALTEDAAPYIVRLSTDNGYNFKNGQGSSTITAKLEKYSKIVNANWKWLINNSIVSETSSVTINASQVVGTLNVVAVASVGGNEVAREYITFTNSDDGVGIKSIKRYYTTNDQAEGVTAGGQNWSTKPTTVTADKNYMWSYDVITYTNDTSLVTEPSVIGARGDDGLDADTTGITEALDKAKQELTALSANIEKVRDDSLAAVAEAKQQLTAVVNDLSTAKQDLQTQASQLQAQASAQTELTKRVSTVEETANGTKSTVSELSKTVDSNTKNITSVTARTKVVEDDLTSTKTTLSQVQTTADSTSQKTATLETGLNGLNARFETLKIGSRNYFKNSKSRKYYVTDVETQDVRTYIDDEFWQNDTRFTKNYVRMSFDIAFNPALPTDFTTNVHFSASPWYNCGGITFKGGTTALQHFDLKFNLSGASNNYKTDNVFIRLNNTLPLNTAVSLENFNLYLSAVVEDYSQSEADIESKLAEYKQTADQNYASLQSNLQTLDGTVKQNKSEFDQTASQIKSSISAVEGKIPTEIGGRNLWIQSKATGGFVEEILPDNHVTGQKKCYRIPNNKELGFDIEPDFSNRLYRKVTFSAWVKYENVVQGTNNWNKFNCFKHIMVRKNSSTGATTSTDYITLENFTGTSDWKYITYTYDYAANKSYDQLKTRIRFNLEGVESGNAWVTGVKIEVGSIPSDYSPAPEDTESDITKLNTTLTQTANGLEQLSTQVTSQGNTITSHTNSINSLSTGLSAKVSQTDFNTLSGRVTTAENNITAKANELSSKISSVEGNIPSGEMNLVEYGRPTDGYSPYKNAEYSTHPLYYNSAYKMYIIKNTATSEKLLGMNRFKVERNTDYTLYFKGFNNSAITHMDVWFLKRVNGSTKDFDSAQILVSGRKLSIAKAEDVSVTFNTGNYDEGYIRFDNNGSTTVGTQADLYFGDVSVKKGKSNNGWSPSQAELASSQDLKIAQSEIKQTTDAISASVSALDSSTVKTASLNLDNNGFVTKVGKTVNGNTFATMIAQDENDVQIIAKKMKVSGDMIVNGAITAEKLNINSLSALSAKLGDVTSGSITNAFSSGTRSGNIKIKDNVEITSTDTSNLLPEKAKENLVLSTGSLAMNASTSSDEATHSMLIMPETIKYTKNNYDTTRGGTNGWSLTHNGYYSMLQVDMVWQNVRLNNTSNLMYGIGANYVRIGNLVTISINRQITSIATVADNQLANETIPEGFRPISQAHLTLTGNTGSTIDATCIVHLNPDGTIRFTNNKSGNRVWTGTVTYTCVEPMPYVKDLNNGSTI